MIVINLFGVPGTDTSGAVYIFSQLKIHDINAELIIEYAKEIWEDNNNFNQIDIFNEQSFIMSKYKKEVDVIVTNSPLLLSALYNKDSILGKDFNKVVYNVFDSYDNMNYLIISNKKYDCIESSNTLIIPLHNLLAKYKVTYKCIPAEKFGYDIIVDEILRRLNK